MVSMRVLALLGLTLSGCASVSDLIAKLSDIDPRKRQEAVTKLGTIDDDCHRTRIGAALRKATKDSAAAVRAQVTHAIVHHEGTRAASAIIEMLDDPSREVRAHAIVALLEMTGGVARLHTRALDTKTVAALSPATDKLLAALAESESQWMRMDAARLLGRIGSGVEGVVPSLMKAISGKDPYQLLELEVRRALDRLWPARTDLEISALVTFLVHGRADIRSCAVEMLGRAGASASAAIPRLLKALEDDCPTVRLAAAHALGSIGREPEKVVPALLRRLNDVDVDVRFMAAEFLATSFANGSGLEILLRRLTDECLWMRFRSALALTALGKGAKAAPVLARSTLLPDPSARARAVSTLGKLGSGALPYVDRVLALRNDPDGNVRRAAREAAEIILSSPGISRDADRNRSAPDSDGGR